MIFNFKNYFAFPRRVYLLFLMKFLMSFQTVLVSLLSLLFHDKMNLNLALTGNIISVITVAGAVGVYIGGTLASYVGGRIVIRILLSLAAFLFGVAAMVEEMVLFCLIFLLAIFCMMALGPAMETLISIAVPTKLHKRIFSFTYLGSNVGYGFFVLIITNAYQKYLDIICVFGMIICLILLVLFEWYQKLFKAEKHTNQQGQEVSNNVNKNTWEILRKNKSILCAVVIFCIIYSQFGFTVPLHLNKVWGEMGVSFYGVLGMVNAVVVILGTPIVTLLVERKRESEILALTGGIYGISFIILGLPICNQYLFMLWVICFTLAEIMYSVSLSSYIASNNRPEDRNKVYALSNVSVLTGYVMGQNLSGYLVQYNVSINFIFVAVLALGVGFFCFKKLKDIDVNMKG